MKQSFRAAAIAAMLAVSLAPRVALSSPPDMMGGGPPGGPPSFLREIFPPRFVMENQQELGLRPAQAEAIKKFMAEAQQELLDLQWKLDADSEALAKLLAEDRVDEAAALKKLGEVTATEQQVKMANFRLLVRIKNELDPGQQAELRSLRAKHPGPPDRRPLPPPPM